jgi:predicted esterase
MRVILSILAVCGCAGMAMAQPEPASPPPQEAPPKAEAVRFVSASRMDLALAYLQCEKALRASPPTGEKIADYNRRFDQASIAFFSGRYTSAVQTLGEMVREIEGRSSTLDRRVAESLRVTTTAAVIHPGNKDAAAFTFALMFLVGDAASEEAVGLDVVLMANDGREAWRAPLGLKVESNGIPSVTLELATRFDSMPRGDFQIVVASRKDASEAIAIPKGRVTIRGASVEEARVRLEKRLKAISPKGAEGERAVATAKARAGLLIDEASTRVSARFLASMDAMAAAVEAEVAAIEKGENPYKGLAGDHWRVVMSGEASIPCRVYVPAKIAAGATPVPLVVAFHGAGGDESMFFEGYGGGLIRDLADKHGFVAVCPLTYSASSNGAFDRVVEDLSADYAIDSKRVYLIGHSMGAGAVSSLAAGRAEVIAAAACIAGGGLVSPPKAGVRQTPRFDVAAELDPLFSIERARRAAKGVKPPSRFVEASGWGHTLVVGHALPEVVEWLLEQKLP